MPAYEWSYENSQFAKLCGHCKRTFLLGKGRENLHFRLSLRFGPSSDGVGDGYHSWCRECVAANMSDRRWVDTDELRKLQNNRCLICAEQLSGNGTWGPCVDHDHNSGVVRGILCKRCNTWMAAVDNDEWLAKAVAYRNRYREDNPDR